MIVLQLKSSHDQQTLESISYVIKHINTKFNYKIKGHEIHQISAQMEKTTLVERAKIISSFCAKNEIEYLTYHTPIIKENIYDIKWCSKIVDSLLDTIRESEKVASDASISNKPIIVFHLTSYVNTNEKEIPITKEIKYEAFDRSRLVFYESFLKNSDSLLQDQYYILAIENSYPSFHLNREHLTYFILAR